MTCHLQVISEAFTLTRSTLDAGFATSFGGGTDGWSRVAISTRDSRSPAHLLLLVGHPGREAEHHVSGVGQRPRRHSGTPASLEARRHSRLIRPRLCPNNGGHLNLFLACEPLAGWRQVAVTQRRTMQDFAHQMRWLVDEAYPEVPVVRLVLDNLNTHRPASLYETFPAAAARRIAKRLEFHYTPKHGSWLNMAEIEFSVLSRCCLKLRLPDEQALRRETQALVRARNAARTTINWRFNTKDARTKLHRLYPSDFTVD